MQEREVLFPTIHRLIAVVESMDNGKPIRESRDLDIPLVARHFYHHAGTAVFFRDGRTKSSLEDLISLSCSLFNGATETESCAFLMSSIV